MNTNDISFAAKRMFRGDFKEQLNGLLEEYEYVCKRRDEYAEQLRTWNKDEEIQKARSLAAYYRGHSLHELSDEEAKRISEFRKKHYESCKNAGTYIFELAGTGIGEAISIKCPVCGQEENVTDYSNW